MPTEPVPVVDRHGRPLGTLRISVTDRCNLRCAYCMPEPDYVWLPRRDILTFEELERVVRIAVGLGLVRVRLTGGEPLMRTDLDRLVARLAAVPGLGDLALTTNGLLLADQAAALRAAGLSRLTVSLDTLREDRFEALTRRRGLDRVLAGLTAACAAGFEELKLDTVVMRGVNDDELEPLLALARHHGAEIRFIEYMDVGGATRWSEAEVVSREELLARLAAIDGPLAPLPERASAPARRFRLASGQPVGIIASTTAPFCAACDRARITADGMLYLCLYARLGANLRDVLRSGADDAEVAALLERLWAGRGDRGAEDRLAERERAALADRDELRGDPHLEMHTRGG